jgi:hypothetical protein
MAVMNDTVVGRVCGYCGQPLQQNHGFAWRSTSGKLYCSEFCAADEEEAVSHAMGDSNLPSAVPS